MPKRRVVLALAFGFVVLCITSATGRQRGAPPPPPGGAAAAPATGTGLIVGRVLDADGDKPMPGATVTVMILAAQPSAFRSQAVVTGSDGVFVFRNLPKGSFGIRATLTGFMLQSVGNGAPATVTLDDAEKVNDVALRMWRFGAISGQLVDEQGEGVEGITLSLVRSETIGGRRTLNVIQQSRVSDDRGAYRMTGLAPGDYSVCALFTRHIAPVAAGLQSGDNTDMQRTLSGSGAMAPSGSGYRVGEFMLISASGSRNVDPAPGEDGRLSVFADACYSASPTLQGAQLVRVISGQERTALNLTLRIVPSVRIIGTLTGPANRLAGMAVHLYPAAPGESSITSAVEAAQTVTDPSGTFGFVGVPAGSYVLRVVFTPSAQFDDRFIPQEVMDEFMARGIPLPSSFTNPPPNPAPTEPALWATAAISVGDTDISGVSLVLREAFRVSGRLVFEGTQPKPAVDRLAMAVLNFESLDPIGSNSYALPRGRVSTDGTFTAPTVVPGRYLVTLQGGWPGWTVKSITANGRDIFDDPLDVTDGDVTGVVVTLTDRPTELSGTVRTDSGVPDTRARVLVFPADRTRWTQTNGGRRLSSPPVSKDGAFSATGLPAGEYFVVAVGSQAVVNWQDPKTLEALSRVASRATVRDGERRSVNLVTSVIR